jgi:large subunit ribosomal protein L5
MRGEAGGILDKEMPLDISNVAIFNPITHKADRVGFKSWRMVARFEFSSPTAKSWTSETGSTMARLQQVYHDQIVGQLKEKFGYKSVMEVPRITKITLNMGVGEAVANKKVMESAVGDMEQIAGQKAIVTISRKSVAGFKIREGWPIGCKVTLRRERMYEFLDRLINIAIPASATSVV